MSAGTPLSALIPVHQSPAMSDPQELVASPPQAPPAARLDMLRPWGPWATTAWGLVAMIAWLVGQLAVFVAYAVELMFAHSDAAPDFDRLLSDAGFLAITVIVSSVAQCGAIVLAVRRAGWPVGDYLGLYRPPRRELAIGLAAITVILVGTDLLSYALGRDLLPPFMVKTYHAAREGGLLILLFAAIVVAPIAEEIMFRAFLFRGWAASRLTVPGTIFLTSAIWASIHLQYDWFGVAQIFCIGILFGYLRWRSRSTTLTILLHGVVNLAAAIEAAVIIEYFS